MRLDTDVDQGSEDKLEKREHTAGRELVKTGEHVALVTTDQSKQKTDTILDSQSFPGG